MSNSISQIIEIPSGTNILIIDDEYDTRFRTILNSDYVNIYAYPNLDEMSHFITILDKIDIIFLDHDLGVDETILPFVDYLQNQANLDPHIPIIIHSLNPPGAANIYKKLTFDATYTNVTVIPNAGDKIIIK